jgi:hypothetical protein
MYISHFYTALARFSSRSPISDVFNSLPSFSIDVHPTGVNVCAIHLDSMGVQISAKAGNSLVVL